MKLLNLSLLLVFITSIADAKMTSVAELSNIRSIKIEDDKITIVGDGVFHSRMVTTEANKDSNFVIGGQPSIQYTTQANETQFVVTPYTLPGYGEIPEEDQQAWDETNAMFQKLWEDNLAAVKLLKESGKVTLIFQMEEIRFVSGNLASVEGSGMIQQDESE